MIETAPVATYQAHVPSIEQLLPLPAGGAPTTVYISITGSGTNIGVAFSLSPTGTTYPDGMSWPVDAEYALFLNVNFLTSTVGTIKELQPKTPGLWVSQAAIPAPTGGFNQLACVQDVPGTYDFKVSITTPTGDIHVDPKIVVTPL